MFGYIDESGASGAIEKENDWLVISLVIFEFLEQKKLAERSLNELRSKLQLSSSYEFHRAHNSVRIRNALETELKNLDFTYLTFAYKKTLRKEDASYKFAAEEIIAQIQKYTSKISILTDTNPTLLKHLNKNAKKAAKAKIRITSEDSRKSSGLQIADYIVNICLHKVREDRSHLKSYRKIQKKELDFLITENYH